MTQQCVENMEFQILWQTSKLQLTELNSWNLTVSMLKLCELAVLNDAATPYEMKILMDTHHNDGIGSKPLPNEFVT